MGRYYYGDENKTREKYSVRISDLEYKRNTFLNVGTRKVKLALNKIAKTEIEAKLLRVALEVEDQSICAKKYENYSGSYYEKKDDKLDELVKLCIDNKIVVGYSITDDEIPLYIVYCERPYCEQISFHTTEMPSCGLYNGTWDGKENSILDKLEVAIGILFDVYRSKNMYIINKTTINSKKK